MDPQLGRVMELWHQLPLHIRAAILALVDTASKGISRDVADD